MSTPTHARAYVALFVIAVSWASYPAAIKLALRDMPPLTLLIIPTAIVTAPLFPAPRFGSVVAWTVVVYQALVGAVAHVLWSRAIHVVSPIAPRSS